MVERNNQTFTAKYAGEVDAQNMAWGIETFLELEFPNAKFKCNTLRNEMTFMAEFRIYVTVNGHTTTLADSYDIGRTDWRNYKIPGHILATIILLAG